MLSSSTAHTFFLVFDASRRPTLDDEWSGGQAVSLPLASAPEVAWEQLRLPLALRRHRIDVFHRPSGAGGLALRPLAGSRVVVTVHDVIPLKYREDYLRNAAHRAFFAFQMSLSRRADAVITVSETSKRDLVDLGGFAPSKIAVIGEGVDRDFLTAGLGDAPAGGAPYLLAMGGGEPRKNVARVIEGFLRVADRIDHRLLLVGAPWRGRCAVIPPSASGRVQDLGAVTNAQLRQLYRGAAGFARGDRRTRGALRRPAGPLRHRRCHPRGRHRSGAPLDAGRGRPGPRAPLLLGDGGAADDRRLRARRRLGLSPEP
ncbi:MAG: glycosyltransferase family 4 protein [Alphaproteobacteria bacterium]|nr:MAG: glycosyltransferase family 4 protein [Alphaproteobacteria bacterium]